MSKQKINIDSIHRELEIRKQFLSRLNCEIDQGELHNIQKFVIRGEDPVRPGDIETLLKQFCVSSFSYAPLRNNFLKPLIGCIPTRETIGMALSLAFDEKAFLLNSNWTPESLNELTCFIQEKNTYNLLSKQFKPRIICVLLKGTIKLKDELKYGLDTFYSRIKQVSIPSEMWKLVNDFSKEITNVGPALTCDFFKEIGFTKYVKVDHHFRKEFPRLLNRIPNCKQRSFKDSFIESQEISHALGISPFHLDKILYYWGKYGKNDKITSLRNKLIR